MFTYYFKLIFIVISLVLYACSHSEPADNGLVFLIKSTPRTLDPRFATDATSFRMTQLIYQSPVKFKENSRATARLTSWQTRNNRDFLLTIQGNNYFSNGKPLTSQDIVATYQSVMDPHLASPHRMSFANVYSISALNDKQVSIKLKKADPLFMSNMVIGILPSELTKSKILTQFIGSGHYQLTQWDGESDVYLQRKSDKLPITFKVNKDSTVQTLQMLKGDVDIIQGDLSQELVAFLAKQENLMVKQRKGTTYSYLGFNMQDPILKQLEIRRAIAYAIDRDSIIQYLFKDFATKAQSLLTKNHWSSNQSLVDIPYDLNQAKAILNRLGYNEKNPLKLSYKTSKSAFRLRIATLIQDQLSKANIQLDIQSYDWGTFYDDIKKGNFQMYSLSWIGIKNPDIYRYVFHSKMQPPNGANRGRYVNQQVDDFLDKVNSEKSIEAKKNHYAQVQQIIHNDLPYVSLWYEDQYAILSKKAQNYQLASDGNFLSLESIKINSKEEKN